MRAGRRKLQADEDSLEAIRARDAAWRPSPRSGGRYANSSRAAQDRRSLLEYIDALGERVEAAVEEIKATIATMEKRR